MTGGTLRLMAAPHTGTKKSIGSAESFSTMGEVSTWLPSSTCPKVLSAFRKVTRVPAGSRGCLVDPKNGGVDIILNNFKQETDLNVGLNRK